jgi:hypothetical protein
MAEKPAIIDNPQAPDMFADGALGWHIIGGNIKITFQFIRAVHSGEKAPANRVVSGRLVMPVEQAEIMAKGLLEFIAATRAQATKEGRAKLQ